MRNSNPALAGVVFALLLAGQLPSEARAAQLYFDRISPKQLSADGTELKMRGVTVSAVGGRLRQGRGLGVLSPSDGEAAPWTVEIDAWNDRPEGLLLTFDAPQRTVAVSLLALYDERIAQEEIETAQYMAKLSDGSSIEGVVKAVKGDPSGYAELKLGPEQTGGRAIVDVYVTPELRKPSLPVGVVRTSDLDKPFSEFLVSGVRFQGAAASADPRAIARR